MKDIKNDFESFKNDPSSVSGSSFVLSKIHEQLKQEIPSIWKVATKLGIAHLIGSFITLMSCSQFGVQLVFHDGGLMNYFMQISADFCHVLCGALYLSISLICARLLLNREEWFAVIRSRALSIASLALVSLGGLSLASHQVTFEAGILWLFGAVLGGELVTLVKSPTVWLLQKTSRR